MFVAWGPQLGFLYNDAYAIILGAKHPAAMGRRFEEIWSEIWSDVGPLAGDDRSGLYETLIGAREAVKDEEGAHKLREEWATFLEGEAKRAKTAEQRAVYDSHRLSAYLALKQPERAIPMLEESERDFPSDYNPPARLGVAYRTMGKYDEALAAFDRALAKAYGPRKIGILRGKADTYAAKGDKESARRTIEEAIRYAESLPEGQRSDATIAALKKKLETL